MAEIQANLFSTWELTEKEEKEGSIYTITQLQVLQNLLAINAQEKVLMEFDPTVPELFTREEAYKRGQIDILRHLIDNSEALKLINIEPSTYDIDPL